MRVLPDLQVCRGVGWATLAKVERGFDVDVVYSPISLGDKMTTSGAGIEPGSPVTNAVAVMVPETRVRFSGQLLGKCDDFKDDFHISLDHITQDK